MTDMRRANEARIHQQPAVYRGSCNSTPEHAKHQHNSTYPTPNGQPIMFGNGQHAAGIYRTPLLQTLADHMNMSSASGGSTSSSATANIANVAGHCNGNLGGGGGGEIQFDEREIFYVSPSKRKANNAYCAAAPTPPQSALRSCESRLKVSASIAPSYPPITPSAAYGARTSGQAHDFSFEHNDNASHYSDTAMQLLRSGSCSAAATASNLITSAATANCSSSNSSLAQQHVTPAHRTQTNVVTFSSPVGEERPAQFRGSLRRSKGRSSQSLCSCDAGADTEINPDPTRPLYQYSLERRQKGHTYTCEQNAQILMRLERERNRRLSLGGSRDDVQSDTPSSSDIDTIPPIPPPPAMKRNGSMRSLRHFQRGPASVVTAVNQNISTINNKNNNNNNLHSSIATLCNSDILNDCANNALEVGSLIDDCTTSILKCANAVGSELMAATTATVSGISGGSNSVAHHKATLATIASSVKPDVCHVTTPYGPNGLLPHCIRDDIHLPSKKSDPALCFLHVDRNGGFPRAPLNATTQQTQSKYNTIGPSSDCARQLSRLLQKQQQQQQEQRASTELRAVSERCRCLSQSLSNFSRDYFGQSGHKGPERVFLPPLSGQRQQQQQKHHYYANKSDDQDWLKEPPPPPPPAPYISRSYGDLMEIDSHAHAAGQLSFGIKCSASANNNSSSSCKRAEAANSNSSLLNPLKNSSFTTLTSIASSGLKEKLQQQQHPLLHPHHQQKQELEMHHNHHHHHPHHHHGLHQQQQQQSAAQREKQQQQLQLHASVSSIMPWKHRQCPSRGSSSSGTNSFRFDAAKHWLAVSSILLIIGAASVAVPLALRVAASAPFEERLRVAVQLLDQVPLIDGHNDLPWNIRKFLHNKLNDFNFDEDLRNVMPWARSHWSHTDLQRLKKGRISAQFWAAYVPCEAQHRDAVQLTLEQIDVIKRLTDRYAPQLTTCTSAEDIKEAHKNHQLCSLTGVEGGHSLGGSLAVLRTLYAIGVRYMTLTSTCHTPWADSSYADAPTFNVKHGGLTIFGKTIIREMNRLGMMVDLSHVSTGTMRDALEVSEAPVIFSHSSAYEVCNSSRNVQDDMLHSLAKNGGLVMVNFYSKFLSCSENSTVHDAVAHINHIKRIAGIDHVGLGAGFDGINFTPKGLEDVSSYPTLFAELLGVGWSIDDLAKLAGGNFLRVMQQVEKVRDEKKAAGVKPYEDHPNFRTDDPYNCTSS